jgi:putative nucleotidyltransferase with HDIG domain
MKAIPRILFVDDEVMILRAIERLLRVYSDRWDVTYCSSGREAMSLLAASHFDVLVTDIVMPGIDGPTLLHHVRERHPRIARIVLTAHADFEHAVRSVPFAHQRLRKPFALDDLLRSIERATGLCALVGEDRLRDAVGYIGALPSSTERYSQLAVEIDSPSATFSSIAAIIAGDMAMSAKVLQLANSAFVGARREITDIVEAVRTIGLSDIREYALNPFLNVFDVFAGRSAGATSSFSRLGHHALHTAHIAAEIASAFRQGPAERAMKSNAFVAGLLHDIGKLLLAERVPAAIAEIEAEAEAKGCPVEEVEVRRLSVTHAEVGGYLLNLWGLPKEIVDAVSYHHLPEMAPDRPHEADAPLARVLRLANWIAREHETRKTDRYIPGTWAVEPDEMLLASFGGPREVSRLLQLTEQCDSHGSSRRSDVRALGPSQTSDSRQNEAE